MNFFLIFSIFYSSAVFNASFNEEQKFNFKNRSLAYRAALHFLKERRRFSGRKTAIDHIKKETLFWGVETKGFVIIEASNYRALNKGDLVVYTDQNNFRYCKLKEKNKKEWVGQLPDRKNINYCLINEKNFVGTVFEKKIYSY